MKRRELLLWSGAAAAAASARSARAAEGAKGGATPARQLVLVHAVGGWDPTWVLDPKLGLAGSDGGGGEVAAVGGVPIASHPTRPAVDRFFRAWGEQTVVVNGVYVGAFQHRTGARRMLTGSARARAPSLCHLVGSTLAIDAQTDARMDAQIDVAVRALAERRFRAVRIDTPAHWDTHTDNDRQGALWDGLFASLDVLLGALERRRQLGSTTVLVVSELGRAPHRNGDRGKDHWPVTSCVIAGAGIRGGRVLGGTDDALRALPVDLRSGRPLARGAIIEPRHLVAGVLAHVGADRERSFPDVEPLGGLGELPPMLEPENARAAACSGIDRA